MMCSMRTVVHFSYGICTGSSEQNLLVENVNILFGDILSWCLFWNVQQLADLLLFTCCSWVHDFLTGTQIRAECSQYSGVHSSDSSLCHMVCKFHVHYNCTTFFDICMEENLQVPGWYFIYWISESRKWARAGITRKTMYFRRGCWKQRVPCVPNAK